MWKIILKYPGTFQCTFCRAHYETPKNQWIFIISNCPGGFHGKKILLWRHNERDGVSNHQPHDCLLKRLFRRRSKKTSKLCVTGLCEGNSLVTGEFHAQWASNAENVFIWRRHHDAFWSLPAWSRCPTYGKDVVSYCSLRLYSLCRSPLLTSSGVLWNVCPVWLISFCLVTSKGALFVFGHT